MNRDAIVKAIKEALEISDDVSEGYREGAFREVLRHLLKETRSRVEGVEGAKETPERVGIREESIGEFLTRVKSKAHTDVTLAMSYFLLKNRGMEVYTGKDIEELYSQARHPRTNVNLAIIGNVKKGFMIDLGEKKENLKLFAISRLGEDHVEGELLEKVERG